MELPLIGYGLLALTALIVILMLALIADSIYRGTEERAIRRRDKNLFVPRRRIDRSYSSGQFAVGRDVKGRYL